jgi:tRNA threonylcarbamoyl adenosine modification protein (Sua5/YciO/YrdC/YwlC family)
VTEILDARAAGSGALVDPAVVARAAALLRAGEAIVVPTDTVYGLAALPTVPGATDRLFALKGRAVDVPVAVLCHDVDQALGLADPASIDPDVRRIAAHLWPGPLTLVLPRRPGLGLALGRPPTTIGVRCPDHDLVRALAGEVGPLATTSANRHGEPTLSTAVGVAAALGGGVPLVVDGGRCDGAPSTVVDATGPSWRVLREGTVTLAAVEAAAAPGPRTDSDVRHGSK